MFEIYTQEVEINGQKYNLKPLPGKYLPTLYSLLGKFTPKESKEGEEVKEVDTGSELFKDKEAVAEIYEMVFETLKISYPSEPVDKLALFASQNLLKFLEPLIKINLPQK
jgi:hypothetical protein